MKRSKAQTVTECVQMGVNMSKVTDNYKNLARGIGFNYDESTNTIYGTRNGYELLVYATDQRYPYLLTVTTSVRSAGMALGKDEISQFRKSVAPVTGMVQKDSLITVVNKSQKNQDKLCADLGTTIEALTGFLRERNYTPCCQTCGASTQTVGFMLESARLHLCADCAARTKSENEVKAQQRQQKNVNIVGGIIGAVLGSLIGVACIVILGQLGYVAAISGIVMAFCTLKGFDKLGGKLTAAGIVISCVIMAAMTYFGNRLDWAIEIYNGMKEYFDYDMNILQSFRIVPAFVEEADIRGDYIAAFVQQMIFVVVGAVPTIISISKEQKNVHQVAQIGYMQNPGGFAGTSSNGSINNF
ncbi:MAG: hypothetical protein K2I96_04005 [Lachnospiraceae bacterium]|nr:hypothetical protein [Lachnospiraceae bacterium]